MGRDDLARRVAYQYSGAASLNDLRGACSRLGIRHVYSEWGRTNANGKNGVQLLEWASETNRGAVIWYKPSHSCLFLGYDGDAAVIVDPNKEWTRERIPKRQFINRWKSFGGVALTPLYSPGTPKPRRKR